MAKNNRNGLPGPSKRFLKSKLLTSNLTNMYDHNLVRFLLEIAHNALKVFHVDRYVYVSNL